MSKWKSKIPFILIVLFLIIFFSLIYFFNQNQNSDIPYKQPSLVNFRQENFTSYDLNLAKNSKFEMNVTAISLANQTFSIPFSVSLDIFQNETDWSFIELDQSIFIYTVEPDLIVLEPFGEDTFYVSIEFVEDVPLGRYQFDLDAGNRDFTHSYGTTLNIHIVD